MCVFFNGVRLDIIVVVTIIAVATNYQGLSASSYKRTETEVGAAMSNNPIVNVAQGALRGRKNIAKTGKTFYSFSGIPYAAPPIGNLRFKAPQPPEPWSGIRDAQKEGNICPQMTLQTKSFEGDEDCLFLNVHTPQLAGNKEELKKPVMVYIHGGAFSSGSGNARMYGPDYLISEDVLLVTLNYRLGALGFMTTEDSEMPGNAGLKDLVAALKWVKQYIAVFGGNPENVTIFGQSAGAASVHYLVLSPMATGLFQRAIAQSGTALNPRSFTDEGRSRTLRLAKFLGCKSENSREVLEFLKTIPAKKLVENALEAQSAEERGRSPRGISFLPICEEGIQSSEEKLLPNKPLQIIRSGNYNRVPLVFGVTSAEGHLFLPEMIKMPEALARNKDFQRFLPADIFPQLDNDKSKAAAEKLKKFYFGEDSPSQETLMKYSKMGTDMYFFHKVNEAVKEHSSHANGGNPLYFYEFVFDGQRGFVKKMMGLSSFPGVAHGDDLGYLFNFSFVQLDLAPDSPEMKVGNQMVKMWTNFAKTGNPSANVPWLPVTPGKTRYLRIDEESSMVDGNIAQDRMTFWDDLYRPYQTY